MTREPKYIISNDSHDDTVTGRGLCLGATHCVPAGLDTSSFMDITSLGDSFRRYYDPETGRVHDCKEYYERMMAEDQ